LAGVASREGTGGAEPPTASQGGRAWNVIAAASIRCFGVGRRPTATRREKPSTDAIAKSRSPRGPWQCRSRSGCGTALRPGRLRNAPRAPHSPSQGRRMSGPGSIHQLATSAVVERPGEQDGLDGRIAPAEWVGRLGQIGPVEPVGRLESWPQAAEAPGLGAGPGGARLAHIARSSHTPAHRRRGTAPSCRADRCGGNGGSRIARRTMRTDRRPVLLPCRRFSKIPRLDQRNSPG